MSSRYELFCHLYVLQVFFLSDLPFHSFNDIYFE